jgi:hypothetical protein
LKLFRILDIQAIIYGILAHDVTYHEDDCLVGALLTHILSALANSDI